MQGNTYTRYFRLILLLIVLPLPVLAQGLRTENLNGNQVVANQILVKLGVPLPSQRQALLEYSGDLDEIIGVGGAGWLLLHSRSKKVQELLNLAATFPEIANAEPDFVVHAINTPNDQYFASHLWAMNNTGQTIQGQAGTPGADIKAVSAWDITTGSRDFVIGIVDSGIDYNHLDFASNVWSAPNAFTVTVGGRSISCAAESHGFNAITNTCDPMDDNTGVWHGTHVSGTAGALGSNSIGVAGVNWATRLMGLKCLDSTGHGSTSNAINAIEFAIQVKNNVGSSNVRVLNNSWGCQVGVDQGCASSQALLDEINRAGSMLFVAAAGNYGINNDSTPFYPANYNANNIIAVAATDNRDALWSSSNYGASKVHLGAPGVGIYSTIKSGQGDYAFMSGTSMATPHVAGAGALIRSACAFQTANIKATILNNVDPVPSLSGKTVTGGRLNLYQALRSCTVGTPGSTTYVQIKYRVCPPFQTGKTDQGYVFLYVNGIQYNAHYNSNYDTPVSIANKLATSINYDGEGIVSASVTPMGSSCSGKNNAYITLTAKAKGPLTNYPFYLKLSDMPPGGCYACPYFSVAPTATFYLSGGHN